MTMAVLQRPPQFCGDMRDVFYESKIKTILILKEDVLLFYNAYDRMDMEGNLG